MRFNVRCRVCEARHVFTQHPDHYQVKPKCRVCGQSERGFLVVIINKGQVTCWCIGYWFPHRKFSPKCVHSNPHHVDTSHGFMEGLI